MHLPHPLQAVYTFIVHHMQSLVPANEAKENSCTTLAALRAKNQELQRALDASIACIIVLDADCTVRFVNRSSLAMFGVHTASSLLGESFKRLCSEEQLATSFFPTIREAERLGEEYVSELHCQRLDTKEKIVLWVKVHVNRDAEGQCTGYVLVGHDVSEQKKQEEELQRRTQELELMNKAMIGREMRIVELKKEIEELRGVEE